MAKNNAEFDQPQSKAKEVKGGVGGFADVSVWSDGEGGDEAKTYLRIRFQQGADVRLDGEATERAHDVELLFYGSMEREELAKAMANLASTLGVRAG